MWPVRKNAPDAPALRGKLLLKIQSAQSRHSDVEHRTRGDGRRILVEKVNAVTFNPPDEQGHRGIPGSLSERISPRGAVIVHNDDKSVGIGLVHDFKA